MTRFTNSEAARHALVLRGADALPEDILEALAWVDAHPENRAAFDRVERFLAACDNALSDPSCIETISSAVAQPHAERRRQYAGYALAASIVFAFLGLVAMFVTWPFGSAEPLPATEAHYASAIGETRILSLPDGSSMKLGGATSAAIAFDQKQRTVTLSSGQALFRVAHDGRRPFVVKTKGGSATAVGTAFNIHRGLAGTTVTVIDGKVKVETSSVSSRSRSYLGPRMQLSYSGRGETGAIHQIDLSTVLAWEQGKLQFIHMPLDAIVDDLNRYSSLPISINDDDAKHMRLSGVVDTNHIHEWLAALAKTNRIEITITDRGISLRSSRSQSGSKR